MRKMPFCIILGCCFMAFAICAQAQTKQKPGLWEITSSMTMSGGPQMPQMGPTTIQVCVTQAMIDKYGGPYSNPKMGNCQTTNVSMTASGMTASLVCSGQMTMTGTVNSTFVDANTTKTTMQMTMTMGGGQTMNMTTQSTATYKGADCGSVKPLTMPAGK